MAIEYSLEHGYVQCVKEGSQDFGSVTRSYQRKTINFAKPVGSPLGMGESLTPSVNRDRNKKRFSYKIGHRVVVV